MVQRGREVYELKAEDIIGTTYSSKQINLLMGLLDEVKDTILSETDDLERWKHDNPLALEKLAKEFKYQDLFYGTDAIDILNTTPEMIWSLSRVRDTDVGLKYFFKILGVKNIEDILILKKPTMFFNNKDEIYQYRQSIEPCYASIDLTTAVNYKYLLNILQLYTLVKSNICETLYIFIVRMLLGQYYLVFQQRQKAYISLMCGNTLTFT